MIISRRRFLALFGASSAAIVGCGHNRSVGPGGSRTSGDDDDGTGRGEGGSIGPYAVSNKVVWLQGTTCSGCSVSFLNRVSAEAPETAADVLLDVVLLGYHPTLMAAAGESAVAAAEAIHDEGSYLLVIEGGVPTAFGGNACQAWSIGGKDVTFLELVQHYAERAGAIVCVGTCAAWGGVAAAPPNPAGVQGVKAVTGRTTLNVAGCPPHPDWIVWSLAGVLGGAAVEIDGHGRPRALYRSCLHDACPRNEDNGGTGEASTFGIDRACLEELGCAGPRCYAPCPTSLWNGGASWCVDANAPCIACTEPDFPRVGLMVPGESEGAGDDD
jgi:hydrogenase small subunit